MAVELRYRIVDVFSDRPLAGNALCVVLDSCPDPVMQAIAREVNLSETTFSVVTEEPGARTFGEYDLRIFTPTVELPFAGHPTIGTAWVLGEGTWLQTSPGMTLEVKADGDGATMRQPQPTLTAIDAADAVAALGLPGAEGAWVAEVGGLRHVLVPTTAPIGNLQPDLAAVARAAAAHGAPSLCPIHKIDGANLHVRVFVPGAGVAEDPGTGSAAGPIGVLARQLWGTDAAVVIRQGDEIGRACRIEVEVTDGGVLVGGRVSACAEGKFVLGSQ